MSVEIKLIVGLGNPGGEYEHTRHNVGRWFLDRLLDTASTTLVNESKFKALVARANLFGQEVFFLFPKTYMNLSGQAVGALASYYHISPENILVMHDDLDLPAGCIRLKVGGGHGGHNGLKDIIQHLHSQDFVRLRIGINRPNLSTVDYVLSKPTSSEKQAIEDAMERTFQVMPDVIQGRVEKAMQVLHTISAE